MGWERPGNLPGVAGLIKRFKLRQMGWMPRAGLMAHLGHEANDAQPSSQKNRRNGERALALHGQDAQPPVSLILSFRVGETHSYRIPPWGNRL
jgi:hypothetical protein